MICFVKKRVLHSMSAVLLPLMTVILLNTATARSNKGYNILFLSPITAPSHSNFFKPVIAALAGRGHTITYWNGLKPSEDEILLANQSNNNLRLLYSDNLAEFNTNYQISFKDRL